MDTLNVFGGVEPIETLDYELDDRLKECKTAEEREDAIKEYVSLKVIALGVAFFILIAVLAIMVAIIYFINRFL